MQKQVCATLVIETLMDTEGEEERGKVCLETVDVNVYRWEKGEKRGRRGEGDNGESRSRSAASRILIDVSGLQPPSSVSRFCPP